MERRWVASGADLKKRKYKTDLGRRRGVSLRSTGSKRGVDRKSPRARTRKSTRKKDHLESSGDERTLTRA